MRYIIDIDGVISHKLKWNTHEIRFRDPQMFISIRPNKKVIKKVNDLFEKGHEIVLHTSRIWHDYNVTVEWLKLHGVKYNTLVMAKPLGDFYIDDKNMSVKEFLAK